MGGISFGDENLRLIVNELTYAPESQIAEVISDDATLQKEIYFSIPAATRSANLKVILYGKSALLPIKW